MGEILSDEVAMLPYPWSELDGWIGLCRAELWRDPRHERSWSFVHDLDERLQRIQRELAALGQGSQRSGSTRDWLAQLEAEHRAFSADLEPLRAPLAASGGVPGCTAHLARAACGRVRRELQSGDSMTIDYLVGLERLLFVMARAVALKLGHHESTGAP